MTTYNTTICSSTSQLELSLAEAEEKIAGLLQVKEKLFNVQVMRYWTFLAIVVAEIFSITIFVQGGEGEAGGRRDSVGGGTFHHSSGQQNSHCLYSHSHHR